MGSLGEAILDLIADPSKLDKGLDEGKGKVTGALDGLKGTFGDATGTMMGQLSAGALRDIGQGIISVGKDITGAALDAEQAQAQLNSVIESTGGAAGVSADMANEYANALSQVTMFDDEAILGGEAMLLTFTNIGQDVFPQATQTILDMSQALGQDLNSSAMQLGKALNDPIQGITALRRVGVSFTEDQEKMIKTMVESGDVAGAQKMILAELSKEFGGSAVAAGETMAGQLAILNTEFGNVKEEAGAALLPVLKDLVGVAKQLMPYLQQAIQWFSGLPTPVKTGAVALLGLVAVLAPLLGAVSAVISIATALVPVFAAIGAALMGPVGIILAVIAVLALLYFAWKNNWGGIQTYGMQVWNSIKAAFQAFTAFVRGLWEKDFGGIRSYFETVWKVITSVWKAISAAFRGDWTAFGQYLRQAWDAVWGFIVGRIQAALNRAVNIAKSIVNGIKAAFKINWIELGKNIIDGLINGLKNGISAVKNAATNVAKSAFDAAKGFLGIKSPSTMFASLGNFSGLGFVQGFQKTLTPQSVTGTLSRATAGAAQAVNRSMQNNINIYNPKAEAASGSVDKTLRKMSYLGVVK
jgi:phage-related protein